MNDFIFFSSSDEMKAVSEIPAANADKFNQINKYNK